MAIRIRINVEYVYYLTEDLRKTLANGLITPRNPSEDVRHLSPSLLTSD